MMPGRSAPTCAVVALVFFAASIEASVASVASNSLIPSTMPRIATVDERYQSYNVEMAELRKVLEALRQARQGRLEPRRSATTSDPPDAVPKIGQDPAMFMARPAVNLANGRLRAVAAALGPAYVRVSGTWANSLSPEYSFALS